MLLPKSVSIWKVWRCSILHAQEIGTMSCSGHARLGFRTAQLVALLALHHPYCRAHCLFLLHASRLYEYTGTT